MSSVKKTANDLLNEARKNITRLSPEEMQEAKREGALIVDTRTGSQRKVQGDIPGAIIIDRTVLEWRLDPMGGFKIPEATDHDLQIIVVCRHGYSSTLAAESLRRMGLWRATDLAGGFEAYRDAGLPILFNGKVDIRR